MKYYVIEMTVDGTEDVNYAYLDSECGWLFGASLPSAKLFTDEMEAVRVFRDLMKDMNNKSYSDGEPRLSPILHGALNLNYERPEGSGAMSIVPIILGDAAARTFVSGKLER